MKIAKKIGLVLLVVLIIMQFFRIDKNTAEGDYTADFEAEAAPPAEVVKMFEVGCYDCHSNNTDYPWYAEVAPISFWLADHVKHAKGHLNFSEWKTYSTKKKKHKIGELIEMIEEEEMPLPSYTWIHKDAVFTSEQTEALLTWARQYRVILDLENRPQ